MLSLSIPRQIHLQYDLLKVMILYPLSSKRHFTNRAELMNYSWIHTLSVVVITDTQVITIMFCLDEDCCCICFLLALGYQGTIRSQYDSNTLRCQGYQRKVHRCFGLSAGGQVFRESFYRFGNNIFLALLLFCYGCYCWEREPLQPLAPNLVVVYIFFFFCFIAPFTLVLFCLFFSLISFIYEFI